MSLLGIGGKKVSKAGGATKKKTPGEIRIQKVSAAGAERIGLARTDEILARSIPRPQDIAELDGGDVARITFPNPNDLTSFNVDVTPDTGFWKGATYHFTFNIPAMCVASRTLRARSRV